MRGVIGSVLGTNQLRNELTQQLGLVLGVGQQRPAFRQDAYFRADLSQDLDVALRHSCAGQLLSQSCPHRLEALDDSVQTLSKGRFARSRDADVVDPDHVDENFDLAAESSLICYLAL